MNIVKEQLRDILRAAGVEGEIELSTPPNAEMGDFAFPCFALAKQYGKSPNEVAKDLAEKIEIQNSKFEILSEARAFGPYVNFFLNASAIAPAVLDAIKDGYGTHNIGRNQKVLVEFAHPNTHKAFHIGHLRNISTGESICRILKNAGYAVHPVNYQGDVGMHIAKTLWGIEQLKDEYEAAKAGSLQVKANFLGKAYATGGTAFENDESVKAAIVEYNTKIYEQDDSIKEIYEETRGWSLAYFDNIYERVGTTFDRLYFESEVAERGAKLVQEHTGSVFKESQGAIIFPGSEYGLHDRVFINSKGYPTYEGKEVGLAELQFREYTPERIIHITGSEQSNYFEVVMKAIAQVFPETDGKEEHMSYGWVTLKGGKMSSRTGDVVLGEWLLDTVEATIADIMKDTEVKDKEEVSRRVALAAVKYSMLKTGVKNDITFDLEESISTSGDSGPYLLYIVARIKSILTKTQRASAKEQPAPATLAKEERQLLFALAGYPEVTAAAVEKYDPSQIAKYLFDLAQRFNSFYAHCPVLDAEESVQTFRLSLIAAVLHIMEHGLDLLGIQSVEEM